MSLKISRVLAPLKKDFANYIPYEDLVVFLEKGHKITVSERSKILSQRAEDKIFETLINILDKKDDSILSTLEQFLQTDLAYVDLLQLFKAHLKMEKERRRKVRGKITESILWSGAVAIY